MINRHTINNTKGIFTIPNVIIHTGVILTCPLSFKIEITKIVATVTVTVPDDACVIVFKNHADQSMGSVTIASGDDPYEQHSVSPTSNNVINTDEHFKIDPDGAPTAGECFIAVHYTTQ